MLPPESGAVGGSRRRPSPRPRAPTPRAICVGAKPSAPSMKLNRLTHQSCSSANSNQREPGKTERPESTGSSGNGTPAGWSSQNRRNPTGLQQQFRGHWATERSSMKPAAANTATRHSVAPGLGRGTPRGGERQQPAKIVSAAPIPPPDTVGRLCRSRALAGRTQPPDRCKAEVEPAQHKGAQQRECEGEAKAGTRTRMANAADPAQPLAEACGPLVAARQECRLAPSMAATLAATPGFPC